jgi:EmrB/QacA subfamily drug resistance transporter
LSSATLDLRVQIDIDGLVARRLIFIPGIDDPLATLSMPHGETRETKTRYMSQMPETKKPLPPPSGPQPGRWVLSHGEIRTIVLGLMLAMFLAALNQTIVATALPTIGRDFRDFEMLPWVVTAYLLTSTAVAPLYGKLSDIHGRRAMMLASIGIFIAGSAACAAAPDMIMLILGRGLQGIGGGGILPLAQAILADAVAPRERGRYQAYMGSVWITAGLGGPLLGGILADHFHWSVIFWVNVPVGLVAAFMTHKTLKRLPRHDHKHKLDLLGAGLMMAWAIPLLLALTWGGTRYPWLSPPIAALLLAAAVLLIGFTWRLTRAPEPFLPLPVLANPVMRMGTVCTSFSQGVVIGLTIFLPLYFEVVHKFSASDSGLALIPIVVMSTPGSILAGRAMMSLNHYKRVPLICLSCSITALSLLVWNPAMPPIAVAAVLSVVAFGIGTTYPVGTVSIQNAVSRHQVGAAMGAMNFFRGLTAVFIVAVMGAIVLAAPVVSLERSGSGTVVTATALGVDLAHVFRGVFALGVLCLVVSLIALIRMEERPLRGRSEDVPPPVA